MAETNGTNGGNTPSPGPDSTAPQVNVVGQYIKDLSFECPDATRFFRGPGKNPNLQINFNVQVRNLQQDAYEVALSLEGEAKSDEGVLYNIELIYAGAFILRNLPQEAIQPVLFIECPRFFFRSSGASLPISRAKAVSRRCSSTRSTLRGCTGAAPRWGRSRRSQQSKGLTGHRYHVDRFACSAWMRVISDDIQDRMTASASMGRMPW